MKHDRYIKRRIGGTDLIPHHNKRRKITFQIKLKSKNQKPVPPIPLMLKSDVVVTPVWKRVE